MMIHPENKDVTNRTELPATRRVLFRFPPLAALIGLIGLLLVSHDLKADTLTVAVASNFAETLERLAVEFERDSSHRLRLVRGSSGRHYAQIVNGAPFDVFFSADSTRPERLAAELGLPSSQIHSYAMGRLVVWGRGVDSSSSMEDRLRNGDFDSLAIANPRLAPYGQAAVQFLQSLELWDSLTGRDGRLIQGENVAQAYQFVATGNVDLGVVALSQVQSTGQSAYWLVPDQYYQPIVQKLVIINESDSSLALIRFLDSSPARAIIQQSGYRVPD